MKLATAYVEIRSDTGKAESDVRSFVQDVVRKPAEIRITADGSDARTEAQRVARAVGTISSDPIDITADGTQAEAEARGVGRTIGAIEPDAIEITADGTQAEGEARDTAQTIGAIDPPAIPIEAEDQTTPTIDRINQRISTLTDADKVVVLKAAADQAEAEIRSLNKQLASVDGDDATVIIKARDETQGTFNDINAEMDKLPKTAQKSASGMTANFVRFFSAAVIFDQLHKAGDAASDLEQQVGGTEAVFKGASDAIGAYAKTADEALGLSERDFRQYTTLIGSQLKSTGESMDVVAQKTIDIAELGADLAATYGGTTKDAVLALGSTFRGEFDSIEQFGVSLRQSEVNAKAVAIGLAESETAVSNAARVTATYQLLLEKTGDAQGQFAAQSSTAGEQAQIAAAKFDNAQASLGQNLLPVMARASALAGTLADAFGALPGPVQTAVIAMAGIAIVAGPIRNAVGSIKALTTALQGATATALLSNPAFLAIATLGTIIAKVGIEAGKTSLDIDSLTDSLQAGNAPIKAVNDNLAALVAEHRGLADVFKAAGTDTLGVAQAFTQGGKAAQDMADKLLEAGQGAGLSHGDFSALLELVGEYPAKFQQAAADAEVARDVIKEVGTSTTGTKSAIEGLGAAFGAFTPTVEASGTAVDDLGGAFGAFAPAAGAARQSVEDFEAETKDQNTTLAETQSVMERAAEAASAFASALDEVFGSGLSVQESQDAVLEKTNELNATILQAIAGADGFALSLDAGTEAGRKNRDQVRDNVSGIQDYIKKLAESGTSAEEVQGTYANMRGELVRQLTQFGLTEAEASDYVNTLGLTPENVTTAIDLQGQEAAKAQVEDYLNNAVNRIPQNVRTAIEAALQAGDFLRAKELIDDLPRNVSVRITASTAGFTAAQMAAFNAERGGFSGAFIPGGTVPDVRWRLAEKQGRSGDEVVLPLGDLPRMRSLISDPRVGPRLAAALDGGAPAVVAGGGVTIGTIVAANPLEAIQAVERAQWRAERANQLGQVYR